MIAAVPSRTAVAAQKVVDVGAGAFQGTVLWRNIDLEEFQFFGGLRPLINTHPYTSLLGNHFALAVVGSTAGPVSQLLRTRLRTDILHVAQNAIATSLTAKDRRLECKLRALELTGQRGVPVDPPEDGHERFSQPGFLPDRKRAPEKIQSTRPEAQRFRGLAGSFVQIESVLGRVSKFLGQLLPLRSQ